MKTVGETTVTSAAESITFRFSVGDESSYRLDLTGKQIGERSGSFRMPFDRATWAAVMSSLESGYDPSAADPETRANLERLGNRKQLPVSAGAALAEALLEDEGIRAGFSSARLSAEASRSTLPVELRFGGGSDVLASLPWELLYHEGRFLVADTTIALSRYPEGGIPLSPAMAELPLRVLLLLPEPEGAQPTFPEGARQSLVDGLRKLAETGDAVVDELRPPTYEALVDAVITETYHMLVFIGHGIHKEGVGSYLVFEDEDGKWDHIPADDVGSTLRNTEVRLVLLGACQSTTISSAVVGEDATSPVDIWQGTAQSFLRAGVPLSIGMQVVVRVDAAQTFIRQFARSLAAGKSVLEATADGRRPLNRDKYDDAWFIPALYGRPKGDTRLFEKPKGALQKREKEEAARSEESSEREVVFKEVDRVRFREMLSEHFNSAELGELTFGLGLDYDDLAGSGKSSKIIQLITYFERRGSYDELVRAAQKARPELDW